MRFQLPAVATAIFFSASSAFAALTSGTALPEFKATDTHGVEVSNESLKGKTVVFEWTNHECPFVVKHYGSGNMQKSQKAAVEKGAVWVSVISSAEGRQGYVTDEEANKIAEEKGAAATHIIRDTSGEIGKAFEATNTPQMYVANTDGVIAYSGAIDSVPSASADDIAGAENYVLAAVDAIAAGETPKTTDTKPYGCGVKYAR